MMSFLKNCKSRPTLILCRHIGGCYGTLVHSGKSSSLSPNVSRVLKNYFWTFPDPILFAGPDMYICTWILSIKTCPSLLSPSPYTAFSNPSAQVDVNPHASEAADASATFAPGVDVEQPPLWRWAALH